MLFLGTQSFTNLRFVIPSVVDYVVCLVQETLNKNVKFKLKQGSRDRRPRLSVIITGKLSLPVNRKINFYCSCNLVDSLKLFLILK